MTREETINYYACRLYRLLVEDYNAEYCMKYGMDDLRHNLSMVFSDGVIEGINELSRKLEAQHEMV